MKKILLSAACLVAVAAAGFGGYTYYENQQMDPWLKANLAALASIEDIGQGEGGGNCPDYNYVPGRYIVANSASTEVICTAKGQLQVGTNIVKGSFDIGATYTLMYQMMNCNGVQAGACCDQRMVGITIIK